MKKLQTVIGIVIVGLIVLFTVQNVATVEVSFLAWSISLPRAVLLFLVFVGGVVAGLIFARRE
ncbi:MAG: LapA family protein [Rhodospirillales bacterium]|nr:LapA family protein [Rhodospirillales bacterium]